jgi:hypothetical protein
MGNLKTYHLALMNTIKMNRVKPCYDTDYKNLNHSSNKSLSLFTVP